MTYLAKAKIIGHSLRDGGGIVPTALAAQSRRNFLIAAGGAALVSTAMEGRAAAKSANKFSGLFPIAETPFDPSNKLDVNSMAAQVRFCTRARVPGIIWPQLVSAWSTLSEQERLAGAEAMLGAAKGSATSVVIGVQAKGGDLELSRRLARHAATHGADAIIALVSLPPEQANDRGMVEYYKAIGAATPLPLVVQTTGNMSVDLIAEIYKQVPTFKCVKDEAGDPLSRIGPIRARTDGRIAVFAGKGCVTMLNELALGFDGYCPAIGFADVFQEAFELWNANKRRQAMDVFGHILTIRSIPDAIPYLMVARGLFPNSMTMRAPPGKSNGLDRLSDADKRFIKASYDEFLKPYTRG